MYYKGKSQAAQKKEKIEKISDLPFYSKNKKPIMASGKRVFFDNSKKKKDYSFETKDVRKYNKINLKNLFKNMNFDYTKYVVAILMISLFISSIFIAFQKINNIDNYNIENNKTTDYNQEHPVFNNISNIDYSRVDEEYNLLTPKEITDTYFSVGGEETILTPVNYIDYTVQKGDTLWDLAKKFKISVDTLYSANKTKNPHYLSIGMHLNIPDQTGLVVKVTSVEEIEEYLEQYDIDSLSVLISNGVSSLDDIVKSGTAFLPNVELAYTEKMKTYGIDFLRPTYGFITSGYGYRVDPFTRKKRFHSGIDIANVLGTPVKAAYDGVVTFAGRNGGYGNCIIIKHPLGYSTLYGHLSKIQVKKGQYVSKGKQIGKMGSTGRSTGSHLHFEIRRFNKTINPSFYVKGLPYKKRK